jgi:uncharacterized membrane protein
LPATWPVASPRPSARDNDSGDNDSGDNDSGDGDGGDGDSDDAGILESRYRSRHPQGHRSVNAIATDSDTDGGTDRCADRAAEAALFEAVIVPHRSLTPRGLWLLIGLICGLCAVMSVRFWLIGAWPVVIFSVVEVGLAVLLLRLNTFRARASEMILLTDRTLRVVRTTANGRREERELQPTWLNVALEEAPGRVPRLVLVARGVREEIGATLGEAERRDLARALGAALYAARNPRFDNPQLYNANMNR